MLTSICLYVPQAQGRPTLEHVAQKPVSLECRKLRYLKPEDPHFHPSRRSLPAYMDNAG
jgi:hypothetical protein